MKYLSYKGTFFLRDTNTKDNEFTKRYTCKFAIEKY